MVYGTYNELVIGAYKPTNITGGPHILYDIWRFPERGVPLNHHPNFRLGFSMFHKPSSDILGYPHDLGPPR